MQLRLQVGSRVWHDRKGLDPSVPEDDESIRFMGGKLAHLVGEINEKFNVPNERIVIGGFSQGGHMAFHMGYRDFLKEPVAGVFVLSSFLAEGSAVYEAVRNGGRRLRRDDDDDENIITTGSRRRSPPLFMAHGSEDWLV